MANFVDTNTRTFTADAAIPLYARVVLEADEKVVAAGITDKEVGTAQQEAFATGDVIAVKLRTATGTHKMIASEAIDAGEIVFTAAVGKVALTASTAFNVGIALSDGSADLSVIEVLYNVHGDTAVA